MLPKLIPILFPSPLTVSLRPANLRRRNNHRCPTMGSKNKNKKAAVATIAAAEPEPELKAPNGDGNIRGKKLIADARFAFSQSDPRFQTHTKQKSKVKIDSRFNRMFTDKNFSTSSTSIDKRGKAKRKDTPNPLKHYYRIDEEDEEEEREEEEVKVGNEEAVSDEDDETEKSSDEDEERKSKLKKLWEQLSESESESGSELEGESDDDDDHVLERDSGGSSDSDFDSDDEVYSEEEEQEEENIPEIDKETSRLAVVNMDWNQVKAVDLYVLLSSFLPKEGHIVSVSVYPSDFGLKRMEEEAVHGPIGLFDDDKKKSESDEEDDEGELDNEKLRAYELSRLRYYYAVVECDSIATADYLYKTCDGVEFERSSNKLDLRFIPDSMEIKHAPRDVAKEAPTDYEGVDFQTRALQQSKIQLTWDEDEPQRSKTLKRKYNADQLAELELKEFLASDESESDEDENADDTGDKSGKRQKKQEMYRALIQSGDGSDGDEEEEGQDMEVTFNTGLEDISKRILEKRDKKSETVWEAYQRKKREKKKSRKNRSKDSSDDDSDTDREQTEEPNDFFIEEEPVIKEHKKASGKSGKKGKKAVEAAEEEASRAELELLLADNNGESAGLKGYNLKRKKGKGKKGEDVLDEEKIPNVDYEDERFSSLFTSHLYALDPTDPQYKRSAAHARQIVQKKHTEERNKQNGRTQLPDQVEPTKDEPVQTGGLKDKYEISSLVKSIKMKSKKAPVPSNGKTSSRRKGN